MFPTAMPLDSGRPGGVTQRLADFSIAAFDVSVAVIAANPKSTIVTSPVGETVATSVSLDSQVTDTGVPSIDAVYCCGAAGGTTPRYGGSTSSCPLKSVIL